MNFRFVERRLLLVPWDPVVAPGSFCRRAITAGLSGRPLGLGQLLGESLVPHGTLKVCGQLGLDD